MSDAPALRANVGAEEGPVPPAARDAVEAVSALWSWCFGRGRPLRAWDGRPLAAPDWPDGLGPPDGEPVYPWLAEGPTAWWPGDPALPEPEDERAKAARALHDKAFAQAFAADEGYEPRALRGCVRSFGPQELADPEAFAGTLRRSLEGWPAWLEGAFALKPRFGTSGRGRVGGRLAELERVDWRAVLPRLAAHGGAVLEPWLSRIEDGSCQLAIAADGEVSLLGTLALRTSEAGLYRGHAGELDSRGRVFSGLAWEEELREAGAALARASAARGYRGPAGLDAFSFRDADGRERLRPIVEWNARFTTGTVVLGLVRRALPRAKARLSLGPGERRAFRFALDAPEPRWDRAGQRLGVDGWLVRLGRFGGVSPALLFGRDREALEGALAE